MSRRALVLTLIASLAINLFVLGGLAGAAIMGFSHYRSMGGPPRLAAMAAALSPQQRDAWQSTVRQAADASRAKLQQARQLRRDAWRGLSEDQVDPQATLAELHRSRTLELEARSQMDRAVVGFAATLPPEDRRNLAQALSRARRGHPPGGWSGRGPGPGETGLPNR